MKIPRYDDLLLPTLNAVTELGGSGTIEEIDDQLISDLQLPDDVLDTTYEKSGAAIFPDRCSWARSYLKIAGFLESGGRGVWVITEAGRAIIRQGDNAVRRAVTTAFNKREMLRRKAKQAASPEDAQTGDPLEEMDWKEALLTVLGKMPPDAFERLCQRVLRESGFIKVEVSGRTGDGGIDGHGVLRVNLVSFQVLFQAKRWKGSVGSAVVRDFRGAMVGRADKGLIITTSTFTRDARAESIRDGAPAIDLVDGEDLCRLLKETKIGVQVKLVEEIEIDPTAFEEM